MQVTKLKLMGLYNIEARRFRDSLIQGLKKLFMALCRSVLILSFPLCGPVSGWLSGMIPMWIMLAVQFEAHSFTSLTSETASSLGALANVLGSALLDSYHVNAQLSQERSPHKPH